jgi:hypothetical protein
MRGEYELLPLQIVRLQPPRAAAALPHSEQVNYLSHVAAPDPGKTSRKGMGGPAPVYDWHSAEMALLNHLHFEGAPRPGVGDLADCERFLNKWFVDNPQYDNKTGVRRYPTESVVRQHANKVISSFNAAQQSARESIKI